MVRKIRQSGGAASAMLALVLLFRLMVPAGYMIGPDHSGRPGLLLCGAEAMSAAEPVQHRGHDRHPAAPADPKPGEISCPYAALAAPPLPPAPPAFLPPEPSAEPSPAAAPAEAVARPALAAPPPPATGPPLPV